jgi:predicted AlkP superfamily pyrophosphatase or phosphodiesterase
MKRLIPLLCAAAWLLAAACGEPARDKKVLVIGIDGVRPDVLAEANTPNIDALIADGTFAGEIETKAQTISGAGWSSMLTGVWPDKHRVTNNDFSGNDNASYPDFLTRLELVNPEFSTFAVLDWPPLGTSDSGGPLISDTLDAKLNFDGEEGEGGYAAADAASVAAAVRYLEHQGPDAAFVYIGNPDVVAHEFGLSPEYRSSIEQADAHVGELMEALRRRPTYDQEDWLILVSTDHGHKDEGGHGGDSPEERTVFFIASGPSALKGTPEILPNLVDVAVTALAHLGVAADPAWQLDGRVIGLAGSN